MTSHISVQTTILLQYFRKKLLRNTLSCMVLRLHGSWMRSEKEESDSWRVELPRDLQFSCGTLLPWTANRLMSMSFFHFFLLLRLSPSTVSIPFYSLRTSVCYFFNAWAVDSSVTCRKVMSSSGLNSISRYSRSAILQKDSDRRPAWPKVNILMTGQVLVMGN